MLQAIKNWRKKSKLIQNSKKPFSPARSLGVEPLEARVQPGSLISPLLDSLGVSLLSALMQQMQPDTLAVESQGYEQGDAASLQQHQDTSDQSDGALGVVISTTQDQGTQGQVDQIQNNDSVSLSSTQTVFGINPLGIQGDNVLSLGVGLNDADENSSLAGSGSSQEDSSITDLGNGGSNSTGFGDADSSLGGNNDSSGTGPEGPPDDSGNSTSQDSENNYGGGGDSYNSNDASQSAGSSSQGSDNSVDLNSGNEGSNGLNLDSGNGNSGNGDNQGVNLNLDLNLPMDGSQGGSGADLDLVLTTPDDDANLPAIELGMPDIGGPNLLLGNLGEIGVLDQLIVPDLDQEIPQFGPLDGIPVEDPAVDPANPVNPNQGQQGNPGGGGQVQGQGNINQGNPQFGDPGLGGLGGLLQGPGLGGFGGGGFFNWGDNFGFGNGPLGNNGGGADGNNQNLSQQGGGQYFGGSGTMDIGNGNGEAGNSPADNGQGGDLSNDPGNPGGGQGGNQPGGNQSDAGASGNSAGSGVPGTGVLLVAPEFVRRNESDIVVVSIGEAVAIPQGGKGILDRDINRDGDFLDANESSFKTFDISGQSTEIDFGSDAKEGTYRLRARVGTVSSNVAEMVIDWHSGYIGDQQLLEIVADPNYSAGRAEGESAKVSVQARCTLAKYLGDFTKSLEAMGMENIHVAKAQNLVTGTIDVSRVMELEQVPHFLAAIKAPMAKTKVGSVTSEGAAVIKAPIFISATGFDGTGVRVGVISDSASPASISASVSSGDLPSNVINLSPTVTGSDEGTAMMEIVYDVAPGSDLAFLAGTSPQVMATGISQLAAAGCKVIVDDLGFANTPVFNDGILSQAIDTISSQGVLYVSAAGNDSNIAYRAAFNPGTTTIGSVTGTFQDLGGGDFLQDFTLAQGAILNIFFQWSSAFLEGGSPLANYQVTNDFSVLIVDTGAATPTILQTFASDSQNTDQALESISFTATTATTYALAFQLIVGANPQEITWMNFLSQVDPLAQGQGGPTTFGQVTAVGAIAVGAVAWNNVNVPETYSALGGKLNFYYDNQGNPLATPEVRQKPDITGPTNVQTSMANFNPFPGTSAAAPHVAGVAALLFSQQPTATVQEVIDHMFATALPVGIVNNPFLTGNGLVQAIPMTGGTGGGSQAVGGENNHSSEVASRFGPLSGSQTIANQVIEFSPEGFPLSDWFTWTAGLEGNFSVLLQVSGEPLEINIFVREGNGLVPVGNSSGSGNLFLFIPVLTGQEVFIEVKGFNFALGQVNTGSYSLTVSL